MAVIIILLVFLLPMIFGDDIICEFPMEIPAVNDLVVNSEARDPAPLVSFVVRSEHEILRVKWSAINTQSVTAELLDAPAPDLGQTPDMRSEMVKLSETETRISFFTTVETSSVPQASIAFDFGCSVGLVLLTLTQKDGHFETFRPGKILELPQANVVVKPNEWVYVRFAVEIYHGYQIELEPRMIAFRNESGLFSSDSADAPGGLNLPFIYERLPAPVQTEEDAPVQTEEGAATVSDRRCRVKAPPGLHGVTIINSISVFPPAETGIASYFLSYFSTFHTKDKTTPLFNVHKCSSGEREPYYDGDVLVLPRQVGQQGCVSIFVSGNPLPSFELTPMGNNGSDETVARLVGTIPGRVSNTLDYEVYEHGALLQGERDDYELVVHDAANSDSMTRQHVRLEAYVP